VTCAYIYIIIYNYIYKHTKSTRPYGPISHQIYRYINWFRYALKDSRHDHVVPTYHYFRCQLSKLPDTTCFQMSVVHIAWHNIISDVSCPYCLTQHYSRCQLSILPDTTLFQLSVVHIAWHIMFSDVSCPYCLTCWMLKCYHPLTLCQVELLLEIKHSLHQNNVYQVIYIYSVLRKHRYQLKETRTL